MPPGTFYISYWQNSEKDCLQIIQAFQDDVQSLLDESWGDLEVFGDNSGSMAFIGAKEDNYIFYYDANVVGDACPETTLYLVVEEDELPDYITVEDEYGNTNNIPKEDIVKIRDIFLSEMGAPDECTWAIDMLDVLYKRGNKIVDMKLLKD